MLDIRALIEEARHVAAEFSLRVILQDITDNTASVKLRIDHDIAIQIYLNQSKRKVNLALVLKNERLYGFDSEGGTYHVHPLGDPAKHVAVLQRKTIREFVLEALAYLDESGLL